MVKSDRGNNRHPRPGASRSIETTAETSLEDCEIDQRFPERKNCDGGQVLEKSRQRPEDAEVAFERLLATRIVRDDAPTPLIDVEHEARAGIAIVRRRR